MNGIERASYFARFQKVVVEKDSEIVRVQWGGIPAYSNKLDMKVERDS